MNDKIKDLQRQIESEKRTIRDCKHKWGKVRNNPETKREPYGIKNQVQGVDMWPEPEGYRDVTIDRWSRQCEKCGLVEYSYKQKAVISDYVADFG